MFCKEYLIDLNATQACVRAGYSKKTAGIIGFENLRKPNIQREIDKLMNKRNERVQLTADKVLTDIEDMRKLTRDEKQYNVSLKASELQGKHLALFTERVAHEGEIKWPEIYISLDS
jgi:phage terminase small subunit